MADDVCAGSQAPTVVQILSNENCTQALAEFVNLEPSRSARRNSPFTGGFECDSTVPEPEIPLSSARLSPDASLHTSYSTSGLSTIGKNCNSSSHLTSLSGRSAKTDITGTASFHTNPRRGSSKVEKPLDHLSRITVCVRKRPLNIREKACGDIEIVDTSTPGSIIVSEPRYRVDFVEFTERQTFRFDYTFDEDATTREVYEKSAAPLLRSIFEGAMATCFAYGQTGSGKTYTMSGPPDMLAGYPVFSEGLQGMVVSDLFKQLAASNLTSTHCITVAFFEIYCNKVYDLLNNKSTIRALEDASGRVQLVGLSEVLVRSAAQALVLLRQGSLLRTSGQTSVNVNSSRSHAIFQVNLRRQPADTKNQDRSATANSKREIFRSQNLVGRFSLIDLAGNERGADTARDGDKTALRECSAINRSLLALKECIRAMGRRGSYLPFRNSKLTQVLRESFVGPRSQTCMIAMVAPSLSCFEHTLNTLRYARRVKQLGSSDNNVQIKPRERSTTSVSEAIPSTRSRRPGSITSLSVSLPSSHEETSPVHAPEVVADSNNHVQLDRVPSRPQSSSKRKTTSEGAAVWEDNAICCDLHYDRPKELLESRACLSDLAIQHENILRSLPKWFYLYRRLLGSCTPEPEDTKCEAVGLADS
ncbi:hypothetical protein AAHC03_022562 [Spirometra sp. Aus1]